MLGWVITCHDDRAQERYWMRWRNMGHYQCRAVNFWARIKKYNMLSRMMCDALHEADSGEGVIF